jgi:anti-repressor protein
MTMNINNMLQAFNYENYSIRTVSVNGEPYFVLKDICDVLGLTNPTSVAERLDSDEVTKFDLGGLSGASNVVNESGLYNVIIRSDKPEARKFRRWVTGEVLPSIRKHGVFATDELLNNPDILINALQALKQERAEREKLQQQAVIDKPKVLFAEAVGEAENTVLIRELAKFLNENGVDVGEKRLFEWLRRDGFLIRQRGTDRNTPTQRAMDLGLFRVKLTPVFRSAGHTETYVTPKVTGKGMTYLLDYYLNRHPLGKVESGNN